ncbi:adenosine 3'-phospho 5'-phosphosulfate transporter 1 [Neodiprion virginianus]|uniref:adenosine 3'-phospho 5'-phosphosulfate transporter 1 n=1 Tax=Neodiprion fabricii TaxID=2872261 RepID=UPI001ED9710C|nr:adenosine 3'-phospho 5'-phosphosulfate transporter 1 [Neodiprion fabricii]XP_046419813.1 adenosine 3'-phospho 5'-phosphosulfate transporter 1 [Neodiprion fabricii]XP_046616700.1 adenosine 3'-phospho 5'-phosphosulfate transporter 1 [Neodiprion virginianus]
MGTYAGELIICILIILSVSTIYGINKLLKSLVENGSNVTLESITKEYSWIVRLCMNSLGYATILLPGYLVYKYVCCSKYLQRSGKGFIHRVVYTCMIGHGEKGILDSPSFVGINNAQHSLRTFRQDALLLVYCFSGLQFSYLTWGYLQEKVMTQEYVDTDGNKSRYRDSQFLVFVNRILAFLMSGLYLLIQRQPRHTTPLYKYTFCSLSNILSSWCQYEALMYVSFPTQVLAKACKIIPVMIMGKIVSRSKYEYYEYVTAVLISIGMTFFMLDSSENKAGGATTVSGVVLLGGYMMLDSFTSNWQNALFTEYSVTSVQMMCGVNMFSCLLTAMSLFQQSSFANSLAFMVKYPAFITDCLLISVCSATGQLYIFYTISNFGAVTFVIIMTIRQGLAILLSCLIYQHKITILGVFGVLLVFGSVFLRIYCSHRTRAIRKLKIQTASINT